MRNLQRNKPQRHKIVAELLVQESLVDGGSKKTKEERQNISKEVMREIESAPIGVRGNELIAKFHSRPFRNSILKTFWAKLQKGE